MNALDIRRQVGQRLWIGFEGTSVNRELRSTLKSCDAGGVTLFARNIPKRAEGGVLIDDLTALNKDLHSAASDFGEGVWISVDQEGGRVQRIKEPTRIYPPMLTLAELPDEDAAEHAFALGEEMGRDLASWGFDINFAPIMDVHTHDDNPIIGDRAFGRTPEAVALRALAFARGLSAGGVLPCCKHFPGHGDTTVDSHLDLPRVDHDLDRLKRIELEPFRAAAAAGIPLCMTAHVVFAALDPDLPATLSPRVVGELLRDEIGYKGVVISDDLDMKAVADLMGVDEAAVRAIEAGCDILLLCRNREHQEVARDALEREATSSPAFRRLLNERPIPRRS